jgi:DNA-binding transcriptional LysR family regulator
VRVSSDHPRGEDRIATAVRAAPAFVVEPKQTRAPPRRALVVALALAGFIAAVGAYKLSLAGEYGPLPHVHAALVAWIVVAYVGCGLVAWTRRPESRFGPLLVAAGLVPALSRLAEADSAALRVFGEGLLLLPAVLFLHVFLAYPNGRLVRPFAEALRLSKTYWIVCPKATSALPKITTFREWLLAEAARDARHLQKLGSQHSRR